MQAKDEVEADKDNNGEQPMKDEHEVEEEEEEEVGGVGPVVAAEVWIPEAAAADRVVLVAEVRAGELVIVAEHNLAISDNLAVNENEHVDLRGARPFS